VLSAARKEHLLQSSICTFPKPALHTARQISTPSGYIAILRGCGMLMRACRAVTAILAVGVLVHMAIMLHRRSHAAYQCEMTYMHPSYERMDVDSKLSWRYGLFLYRDTEAAAPPNGMHLILLQQAMLINEHERARTLPLTRHVVVLAVDDRRQAPVLFLPGNGGNHQQVMAVMLRFCHSKCLCRRRSRRFSAHTVVRCGRWRPRLPGKRCGHRWTGACSGTLRISGRSAQPSMAACW
jgi:hypothetical protein